MPVHPVIELLPTVSGQTPPKLSLIAVLFSCVFASASIAAQAPWVGNSLKGIPCAGSTQGYGPFDYTNAEHRRSKLEVVEIYHFYPDIENLNGPPTIISGDLQYTLRAFPNHHRALQSMAKLQTRYPTSRKINRTPIECYFERAINFSPNDAAVQMLYAIHLHKLGKDSMALEHYLSAEKIDPTNITVNYNLGLLYVDLKRYKDAEQSAYKAYRGGYPLPGLKNKLIKLGYWKPKKTDSR